MTCLTRLLVCPRCRTSGPNPSTFQTTVDSLKCRRCNAAFPIVDGIPVLVPDQEALACEVFVSYVLSQFPERCDSKRMQHRLRVNLRLHRWIVAALEKHGVPQGTAIELGRRLRSNLVAFLLLHRSRRHPPRVCLLRSREFRMRRRPRLRRARPAVPHRIDVSRSRDQSARCHTGTMAPVRTTGRTARTWRHPRSDDALCSEFSRTCRSTSRSKWPPDGAAAS
jgi:uncharacterized protein YbaR (Trm112 family)